MTMVVDRHYWLTVHGDAGNAVKSACQLGKGISLNTGFYYIPFTYSKGVLGSFKHRFHFRTKYQSNILYFFVVDHF